MSTASIEPRTTNSGTVSERVRLHVGGMSCASCQAHVQNALAKVPGVRDANVNLMTNEATVTYDASACALPDLIGAVERTGYQASVSSRGTDAW